MDARSDNQEERRLKADFAKFRDRLLDTTNRNPMLSYKHSVKSKRQLQFVDVDMEGAYKALTDGRALKVLALPEPEDAPEDEKSDDFIAAFEQARLSDADHLAALDALGSDVENAALTTLERALKDKVRDQLGLPPLAGPKDPTPEEHARTLGIDPSHVLAKKAATAGDPSLQTLKWPDLLDAHLNRIKGEARLSEQETGLSTLYLAFGFLEWRDVATAKPQLAPLALLPVTIDQETGRNGRKRYTLRALGETAEINLSLNKRVRDEFGLTLPEAVEPDGSDPLGQHLTAISEAVDGMRDWRVLRMVTLGHFSFGRLAMYADLASEAWPEHPVTSDLVNAIVRGADSREDADGIASAEPYDVDDPKVEAFAPMLIHNADASQHSAIVDVMKQRNLVIEGPPGTGKSQTITNVIAAAIGAGRSVLFLAEKQSALEVVKRRMDSAGLGEFCLEIHSSKATSSNVVDTLRRRHQMSSAQKPIPQRDPVWESSRATVKAYVSTLNARIDDASAFEHIWRYLRIRGVVGAHVDAITSAALPKNALEGDGRIEEGRLSTYAKARSGVARDFGTSSFEALSYKEPARISPSALIRDLQALNDLDVALIEAIDAIPAKIHGSAQDAKGALSLSEALAAPAPDVDVVTMLGGADQSKITTIVGLAARRRDADKTMSALPGCERLTASHRNVAAALEVHRKAAGLDEDLPVKISEEAQRRLDSRAALRDAISTARAVIATLGGAVDPTLADLDGYNRLAAACASAGPEALAWCGWACPDETGLAKMAREWATLRSTESRWRKRLPALDAAPWPAQRDILDAAAHLAKGAIGRLFGMVNGESSKTKALCERLWDVEDDALSPDEMRSLAQHVGALVKFGRNESFKAIAGEHWKGLSTPVGAMHAGVQLRTDLAKAPNDGDPAHAKRVAAEADPEAMRLLADVAEPLAHATNALAKRARTERSSQVLEAIEGRMAALKQVVDADRHGLLDAIDAAPAVIASAIDALGERERIDREIEAHPLRDVGRALCERRITETQVVAAGAWIALIDQALPTASIKHKLIGPQMMEARKVVAEAIGAAQSRQEASLKAIAALEQVHGVTGLPDDPRERAAATQGASGRGSELHAVLSIAEDADALRELGLGAFLSAAKKSGAKDEDLPSLFKAARAHALAAKARDQSPSLARASGHVIEGQRREFAERDAQKVKDDRVRIRNALLSRRPPFGSSVGPKSEWTDMRLLENEFAKERRHAPIRRLASQAGEAILELTPCVMMSPLSLAKFIPPGSMRFDIVVIDEASQMRPEDALGGLLRASQLVVVGDSQQLPPTDFFSRSASSDSDAFNEEEDDTDHESILEACKKAYRNSRRLLWHYRSRCESLIAFSNSQFYEGRLITFPRAEPDSFAIDLIRVNGTCQSRRNVAEKAQICEAAARFMRRHAGKLPHETPTLGIVAINADQAELIGDEMSRIRMRDPLVEAYCATVEAKGEEVFIKNLENVQGDERDYILISTTYGPAPGSSAVLQRFGPINGKHGHRRLNVLFSRARIRVAVFASFGSTDVKISETSSRGVHALKAYLEYAESRGRAIGKPTGLAPDSDFEEDVAAGLRRHGYEVDAQVGASGFRIDLGVRNPDKPGTYLAAVECDGAAYHSSRSARDRDRLREEVLKGLGWTVLRVWSTDWFRDPDGQMDILVRRLAALREKAKDRQGEYVFTAPSTTTPPASAPSPRPTPRRPILSAPKVVAAPIPAATDDALAPTPPVPDPELPQEERSSEAPPKEQRPGANPAEVAMSEIKIAIESGGNAPDETATLLRRLRDEVIGPSTTHWKPHASILRESMIEAMIAQRIDDPDDWHKKVPTYLRQGCDPVEKRTYFAIACDIVSAMR